MAIQTISMAEVEVVSGGLALAGLNLGGLTGGLLGGLNLGGGLGLGVLGL